MPKPIKLPGYLHMSRNYYYLGWGLTTHRRIKNVIMIMEYVPNTADLTNFTAGGKGAKDMTADQERRLRIAFDRFNEDKSGELTVNELKECLKSVDVDVADDDKMQAILEAVDKEGTGRFGFDAVKGMMMNHTFYQMQNGRHYVALSLLEAESLRATMHMGMGLKPSCMVALRALHASGCILLDWTPGFEPGSEYMQISATQCFRFLDSETDYEEKGVSLLLRGLQENELLAREKFFLDVRSCRRRKQVDLATTALAQIFTTPDEFHLLEYRATKSRVRVLLRAKGMGMLDAFRAFDVSHHGMLTCSELFSGLQWLGLKMTSKQVHDLVRKIDSDNDGLVSFEDFKGAFHDDKDASLRSAATATGAQ